MNLFKVKDGPFTLCEQNWLVRSLYGWLTGWDARKYFNRREKVISGKGSVLKRAYYLFWIKRVDSRKNCSFGTLWGKGAQFATMPNLPHGPNGIIVGYDAIIGSNCTVFHQVTVSWGGVKIGDNVLIGAGAKILPRVHIGDNVKIGANCVVVEDIPDGATVVLQKPRIIIK